MSPLQKLPKPPGERGKAGSVELYRGVVLDERYRIVELLGQGGMGAVFFGRHAAIGKALAIKILDCRHTSLVEGATRLFREAEAAAAIGHPNIIDVMDVGSTQVGDPYLVMEYLRGEDLGRLLARQGVLMEAEACALLEPVLTALGAAHDKGIVHRDLKPANIFLSFEADGSLRVKLIDFGIAKVPEAEGAPSITLNGTLLGTPSYMAPEQAAQGSSVDHRADLYSVGVVLYQCLLGEVPFSASDYQSLLSSIATAEPPELAEPSGALGLEAQKFLSRALSKDPEGRYATAAEMLEALAELPGWSRREEALGILESKVVEVQLGSVLPDAAAADTTDGAAASDRSAQVTVSAMPKPRLSSDLASTQLAAGGQVTSEPSPEPPVAARKGRRAKRTALMIAVAVVVFVGGRWLLSFKVERAGSTPSVSASSEQLPNIKLQLVDVPFDATVLLDGVAQTGNPIPVPRGSEPLVLRVERRGTVLFRTTVRPTADLRVRVESPPAGSVPASANTLTPQGASGNPASPSPSRSGAPGKSQPTSGRLGRSGRNTLYYDKFE